MSEEILCHPRNAYTLVLGGIGLMDGTTPPVRLGPRDAGEILTLQRAAYVTEAQLHGDVNLPPLTQTLTELVAEIESPQVWGLTCRNAVNVDRRE